MGMKAEKRSSAIDWESVFQILL